jgi:Tol biopolymer transport system component
LVLGSAVAVALALPVVGLLAASLARPPGNPTSPPDGGGSALPLATAAGGVRGGPPGGADEAIVFASDASGDSDIYRIDPGGGPAHVIRGTGREETNPAISPDGRWIAYSVGREFSRDIWIMNAEGDQARQLTFDPADDWAPEWSLDGRSLVFNSRRAGGPDLFLMRDGVEGFAERRIVNLTARPADEEYPAFLEDGRIALATNYWGGNRDIATIDPARPRSDRDMRHLTTGLSYELYPASVPGGRIVIARGSDYLSTRLFAMSAIGADIEPLTEDRALAKFPAVSPDGSRVVYSRGPFDAAELYLLPIEGGRPERLTRNMKHAFQPDWGYLATATPEQHNEGSAAASSS